MGESIAQHIEALTLVPAVELVTLDEYDAAQRLQNEPVGARVVDPEEEKAAVRK